MDNKKLIQTLGFVPKKTVRVFFRKNILKLTIMLLKLILRKKISTMEIK